ncbi:MAG: secondary thiamine-phosphate synthase enzyme YjbQ [Hyphomicrobiaceae bacterium]
MSLGQLQGDLAFETHGPGFTDATPAVARWLAGSGARDGVLTLFLRHTSASIVVQENADPAVLADLGTALDRLAPRDAAWRHSDEGPDDMPGHVRTMLTGVSLAIPVREGQLALGTWQAIYLAEHRDRPHRRELALAFIGTTRD